MEINPPDNFASWLTGTLKRLDVSGPTLAASVGVTPQAVWAWTSNKGKPSGFSVYDVLRAIDASKAERAAAWAAYDQTLTEMRA